MTTSPYVTFEYQIPTSIEITTLLLRNTLKKVRDQLLSHGINGGGKKLDMDTVCDAQGCGTAACIGGWTSIFLLGFEKSYSKEDSRNIASELFDRLQALDTHEDAIGRTRLFHLFYEYGNTDDYNEPNIAATAIQRYLDGEVHPWPHGEMPSVLKYKAKKKVAKKK